MAALKKGKTIKKVKKTAKKGVAQKASALKLKKSVKNPIIQPEADKYWESKATFNPTALEHDGKVHIIYRAIGDTDNSVLGYVKSSDGHSIEKDSKKLAYY